MSFNYHNLNPYSPPTNGLPLIGFIGHSHVREVLPHLLHQLLRSEAEGLNVVCPTRNEHVREQGRNV